jgi:hypothetical protein
MSNERFLPLAAWVVFTLGAACASDGDDGGRAPGSGGTAGGGGTAGTGGGKAGTGGKGGSGGSGAVAGSATATGGSGGSGAGGGKGGSGGDAGDGSGGMSGAEPVGGEGGGTSGSQNGGSGGTAGRGGTAGKGGTAGRGGAAGKGGTGGAPGGDPGVPCGDSVCEPDQRCVLDVPASTLQCMSDTGSSCPTGGGCVIIDCDGPEDCDGEACTFSLGESAYLRCGVGVGTVCTADDDCPAATPSCTFLVNDPDDIELLGWRPGYCTN